MAAASHDSESPNEGSDLLRTFVKLSIVIGLATSAIFVYVFRPSITLIGEGISWVPGRISANHFESVAQGVSGGEYMMIVVVYMLCLAAILFRSIYILLKSRADGKQRAFPVIERQHYILIAFVTVITMLPIASRHTAEKTRMELLDRMAVARSLVKEPEYRDLRVDFRRIRSRHMFETFDAKLDAAIDSGRQRREKEDAKPRKSRQEPSLIGEFVRRVFPFMNNSSKTKERE